MAARRAPPRSQRLGGPSIFLIAQARCALIRTPHLPGPWWSRRMCELSRFPITARWPASHPDRIQYYGQATPNGVKVTIMLEELGLPYEAHLVDIGKDES